MSQSRDEGSENRGGNGGASRGGLPVCRQCLSRHRPEVLRWAPCLRCGVRHHRRAACPQEAQMAALERSNAQMRAEMQQMRMELQQQTAYGYGARPLLPQPSYPIFPPSSIPWQPQQAMPPMGLGAFPYHQGGYYHAPLPPPSPYAAGIAVGAPQGAPSDTSSWLGGSSGQPLRRGGVPWNNRSRESKQQEKKANGKDETEKKEKKEKTRAVLAAEPSGVQKPGKHHAKNVRRRQTVRAKKEKTGGEEGIKEEEGVEISGVDENSRPETQPSGESERLLLEQMLMELAASIPRSEHSDRLASDEDEKS